MAVAKKRKPMTIKEKKFRAEIKKDLLERGILPPPKPRLNRKKFAKEVIKRMTESDFGCRLDDFEYISNALVLMLPSEFAREISLEHIGVLKVVKIAMDMKEYKQKLRDNGETTYNLLTMHDEVIQPTKDL